LLATPSSLAWLQDAYLLLLFVVSIGSLFLMGKLAHNWNVIGRVDCQYDLVVLGIDLNDDIIANVDLLVEPRLDYQHLRILITRHAFFVCSFDQKGNVLDHNLSLSSCSLGMKASSTGNSY
jgi:hypothetical protein